VNIAVKLKLQW